jgi:hypothetical protein
VDGQTESRVRDRFEPVLTRIKEQLASFEDVPLKKGATMSTAIPFSFAKVVETAQELAKLIRVDGAFEKLGHKRMLAPEIEKKAELLEEHLKPLDSANYHLRPLPYLDDPVTPAKTQCSPAKTQCYDFGEALRLLKSGKKMRRAGWNGKGMWICYQRGYPEGVAINKNTAEATGISEGTFCRFLPYIMMKTAARFRTDLFPSEPKPEFVPWLASQTDLLAEDWEVA